VYNPADVSEQPEQQSPQDLLKNGAELAQKLADDFGDDLASLRRARTHVIDESARREGEALIEAGQSDAKKLADEFSKSTNSSAGFSQ
jgi:hypothetical protein